MERILVSMDARHGAWEAWSRAVSLAKRIEARIYALLVLPEPRQAASPLTVQDHANVKGRLEMLIGEAKAEGLRIDYFISEGTYEDEVIQFIDHNKISLLVAESSEGDGHRAGAAFRKILHRIACRVELVSPRTNQPFSMREGNKDGYGTASLSANRRK